MANIHAVAIISDEAVQAALEADQGKDAKVDTWENMLFTKKGDNMASFITSLKVNYTKGNLKGMISYVVKINPCRPPMDEEIPDVSAIIFRKEGKFFTDLLPELNLFLSQSGQDILPFPKCYYVQYTEGKEMIILEDLRIKGFRMTDKKKGLDLEHAVLAIQGLGRLHAASVIMQRKMSITDIKTKYPFLYEEIWEGKIVEKIFSHLFVNSANILEKIGGYEKVISWNKKLQPNLVKFFKDNYAISSPFSVVCHGDCWINNMLFRYTETGIPVEVMLLDVQTNRIASPATDLNHFMFVSMVGDVRKPNVDRLLTDYFESFSSVLQGYGQDLPYTKEDLLAEYKSKNEYGLVIGSMVVPPQTTEGEDFPDFENIPTEEFQQAMADWNKAMLDNIAKSPFCKPRFLAMYDEMAEEGLISKK